MQGDYCTMGVLSASERQERHVVIILSWRLPQRLNKGGRGRHRLILLVAQNRGAQGGEGSSRVLLGVSPQNVFQWEVLSHRQVGGRRGTASKSHSCLAFGEGSSDVSEINLSLGNQSVRSDAPCEMPIRCWSFCSYCSEHRGLMGGGHLDTARERDHYKLKTTSKGI